MCSIKFQKWTLAQFVFLESVLSYWFAESLIRRVFAEIGFDTDYLGSHIILSNIIMKNDCRIYQKQSLCSSFTSSSTLLNKRTWQLSILKFPSNTASKWWMSIASFKKSIKFFNMKRAAQKLLSITGKSCLLLDNSIQIVWMAWSF